MKKTPLASAAATLLVAASLVLVIRSQHITLRGGDDIPPKAVTKGDYPYTASNPRRLDDIIKPELKCLLDQTPPLYHGDYLTVEEALFRVCDNDTEDESAAEELEEPWVVVLARVARMREREKNGTWV